MTGDARSSSDEQDDDPGCDENGPSKTAAPQSLLEKDPATKCAKDKLKDKLKDKMNYSIHLGLDVALIH